MNSRRKASVLLFVVCIAMLLLASCGGNSYTGVWKAVSMEGAGLEVSLEDQDYTLEINDDGTAALTDSGITIQMNWEATEDGILLSSEDLQLSGTTEDGELILDYAGFDMHFQK